MTDIVDEPKVPTPPEEPRPDPDGIEQGADQDPPEEPKYGRHGPARVWELWA